MIERALLAASGEQQGGKRRRQQRPPNVYVQHGIHWSGAMVGLEYPLSQTRGTGVNEAEFHHTAGRILLDIEAAVEASGADIDFEIVSDILTLEFANGSKIIVNKQAPARQLWVAARSGGFHYGFDPASKTWRNDQSGAELFTELSRLVSEQAGATVALA
jgi:CyaY protein